MTGRAKSTSYKILQKLPDHGCTLAVDEGIFGKIKVVKSSPSGLQICQTFPPKKVYIKEEDLFRDA